MRVLFWTLNFWPHIGGIEVLAAKLLPALRDRGHEFVVVAPKNDPALPDEARYQGIPIRRLSLQNIAHPNGIDHLIELRKKVVDLKRGFGPDPSRRCRVRRVEDPCDFLSFARRNDIKRLFLAAAATYSSTRSAQRRRRPWKVAWAANA